MLPHATYSHKKLFLFVESAYWRDEIRRNKSTRPIVLLEQWGGREGEREGGRKREILILALV